MSWTILILLKCLLLACQTDTGKLQSHKSNAKLYDSLSVPSIFLPKFKIKQESEQILKQLTVIYNNDDTKAHKISSNLWPFENGMDVNMCEFYLRFVTEEFVEFRVETDSIEFITIATIRDNNLVDNLAFKHILYDLTSHQKKKKSFFSDFNYSDDNQEIKSGGPFIEVTTLDYRIRSDHPKNSISIQTETFYIQPDGQFISR